MQDIDGRVGISVQFTPAFTGMPAFGQVLFYDGSTSAADLAGGFGIDLDERPTGPCCLVETQLYKLTPTSVAD